MIATTAIDGREGERRKGEVLDMLAARREVYVNRGRRALLERLLSASTATADAVRDAVELRDGVDPKCFGAVPGPLVRSGIIRRVGFAPTCRAVGHARPVTVWELVDSDAACRWLAAHPDTQDPADEAGAVSTLFD